MVTTNRIVSSDGHIPILDDVYDESSTQKCPLGTRLMFADGRIFKYAQAGASALVAGDLQQCMAMENKVSDFLKAQAAVTAGATVVNAASSAAATAIAANVLADGFFRIRTGAGSGYQYMVKSHTAISSNSAFTINLYDPVKVAIASAASCGLAPNPYKAVIQSPATTATGIPVGVAIIPVTASYFAYLQTWGMSATKQVTAGGAIGFAVGRALTTAGAVAHLTSAVTMQAPLGIQCSDLTTVGEVSAIFLMISP